MCSGVAEVGLSTKLGWEFGEPIARIHLDTVISTTTCVGWLESSVESGAVEGDELIEAITNTLECASGAIDDTVGESGNVTLGVGLANHLLGNFDNAIEDVTNGAAKFAR